jgi:hypothetical protein
MKSPKIFPRLAALVAAALLLNPANIVAAQRPHRRTRTIPRPAATTAMPRPAATPAPQAQATPTPTQQNPSAPAGAQAQQQRRAEPDAAVEELLSADGYGVYVEVRRIGTLARAEEIKTAASALRLFGVDAEPATDLYGFFNDNAEQLSEARGVLAFMPTRAGLPQVFIALELPSPEDAVAFEPKFRRFVGDKVQPFTDTVVSPRPAPTRGAQKTAADKQQAGAKPQGAGGFTFKRYGRLLLTAEEPFTLKKLRGDEGSMSLAESIRFQSARTRLASDALFVYVDTALAQQGYSLEQQKAEEARAAQVATPRAEEQTVAPTITAEVKPSASPSPTPTKTTTRTTTPTPTPSTTVTIEIASPQATPAPSTSATPQPQVAPVEQTAPSPTSDTSGSTENDTEEGVAVVVGENKAVGVGRADTATATKPSEEQVTVWRMSSLLGNVFRGAPRIPGAVALGLSLDNGALAVRLAVENTPDGVVSVIPFLPNVVAGPPVTADAAQVAPDDTDIFLSTSLDWSQIYTNTLGTAALNPSSMNVAYVSGGDEETGAEVKPEKSPTAEETVATVEKLFGFKIKEDLLPALGNEVAVSLPFSYFNGVRPGRNSRGEKKEEKDSEPGVALIIALNDPDKIREILPRVLAAFSFVSAGTPFAPPEKREGYEIRSAGEFSYAIINNFLVASDDVKSVRHVVDSYASQRTLASSSAYRNSTQWQAQQKIVQAYVSEALMKTTIEGTKKVSGGSTDPVVRSLIAQLDMTPEPASYEATNEGDVLLHELRVPANLLKAYAVSFMVGAKDATVISNEAMAVYSLNRVRFAEYQFKEGRKKDHYATLEELIAEKLLEKDFIEHGSYKFTLDANADKFQATATPMTYGKTGRRSFFIDETGDVRGADHKGQPATADDPTVD